jgi:hypothetical protein
MDIGRVQYHTPFGSMALLQAERAFGDRNDEAMIFKRIESARGGGPADAQLRSCFPNRIGEPAAVRPVPGESSPKSMTERHLASSLVRYF